MLVATVLPWTMARRIRWIGMPRNHQNDDLERLNNACGMAKEKSYEASGREPDLLEKRASYIVRRERLPTRIAAQTRQQ